MKQHHALAVWILAACPVLGLLAGLGMSPLVWVGRVTIIAPTASLADEVRQCVVLPRGASMLFYPLNRITEQVRQCCRVKDVSVDRVSPHELAVTVTAREPFAALADSDGYAVISRDGICLYRLTAAPPGLPLLYGMAAPDPPLGSQLSPERCQWMLEVLAGASKVGLQQGLSCDFTYLHHITITTAGGLQGTLGNVNNLARKMTILGRVNEQLRDEGKTLASVDVSTPETPLWIAKS